MGSQSIRIRVIYLSLITLLLFSGCFNGQPASTNRSEESGRIILWHTWSGVEDETLESLLDRFREVYPDIRVISISFDPDQLEREYTQKVNQGLGPDMLIGPQLWTPRLVSKDLIRPLDDWNIEASEFAAATALDTLKYHSKLYGLPLSLQTFGLYYNPATVDTPPVTLEALLEQAETGHQVGIDTTFESAFWGVRAFGGELLDDTGRVVLNQGGFANWLEWLIEARNTPNVILSDDQELLLGLFETGDLDFYVGKSDDLLHLREAMGADAIGVSPLPSGPTDVAGPFLTTEALYFSTASSALQVERAMLLADFLTNTEQQRKLAQKTARIPANPRVRIDRRITPAVAAFAEQGKSATPLLLLPQVFEVIEQGQEAYVQALEGIVLPSEAADELTVAVNSQYDLETVASSTQAPCLATGELDVWHSWTGNSAMVLRSLTDQFEEACANITVNLESHPAKAMVEAYAAAVLTSDEPDLMLVASDHVPRLADEGSIISLEEQVDTAFLQRYVPVAPNAMRYAGQLFGIPLTMETDALFYNMGMVDEPPFDMSDLLNQISPERQFAMAYTPYEVPHWGMGAFGGQLFDAAGNLAINQGGAAEWLAWLQEARDTLGMALLRDDQQAQALFVNGDAAYYVGSSSNLSRFQNVLGKDRIGIVPLPTGPEGASSPLLTVDGLVVGLNGAANQEPVSEYIRFLASQESQRRLMREANLVPANVNVEDAKLYPAISGFMEQAGNATVLPPQPEVQTILALGEKIYEDVLEEDGDPNVTLDNFTAFLLRMHTDPADREVASVCGGDEGEMVVWHSLEGLKEQVLEQIIADYARFCPKISISLTHVPISDLPNQLAASSIEDAGVEALPKPDLLLASHDLIVPLSKERLIKPISNLTDDSTLIPYYSQAIEPLRYDGSLYGLPFAMSTAVLFYNTETSDDPPFSLTRLFSETTSDTSFAIGTDFISSFWGAAGHNPDLQIDAEAISSGEQQLADVFQKGIEDWLKKLQFMQNWPGVVVSPDADQLRELFLVDKATYLVANSDALSMLRSEKSNEEDGASTLGVAMLPAGPNASSAPLMTVDAFLFGEASDDDRTRVALRFAEFATSGQSQGRLLRDAESVPANALALQLENDPQIEEIIRQTGSSIPMPPRSEVLALTEHGNALYAAVLDELKPVISAVDVFRTDMAEAPRPAVVLTSQNTATTCVGEGQLSIWLSLWSDSAQIGDQTAIAHLDEVFPQMAEIIKSFEVACPAISIELVLVPEKVLQDRLAKAGEDGALPDLILGRHSHITSLVEGDLIYPITDVLSSEFSDRYQPQLMKAVTLEDELYGVPVIMDTVALYYNSDLIDGPTGSTLEDLIESALPEAPVVLNSGFRDAFWGISAFGEPLVDTVGSFNEEQTGIQSWLAWLKDNEPNPKLRFSADAELLRRQFVTGNASYLVDGPRELLRLRELVGDQVRVISLPSGPDGDAAPLVDVGTFLFVNDGADEPSQAALIFADFATSEEMQGLLLEPGSFLPVHRTVIAAASDPALESFITMASEAGVVLAPNIAAVIEMPGEALNESVLEAGMETDEALETFKQAVGITGGEE